MVFIDIDMPGMSGPACVQAIRKMEKELFGEGKGGAGGGGIMKTYVVGLINDDYKDIETYIEAGYDEFVNKPVNKRTVDDLVRRKEKEEKRREEEEMRSKEGEDEEKGNRNEEEGKKDNGNKETKGKMVKLKDEITMLAVDDNFFILNGISRLKIKFKYKMEISKGGKLGLQMYLKHLEEGFNYHCLFIDIEMPDMRGPDLAREIRKIEKSKGITPTTWICGLTTEDDKDLDDYMDAGFNEFLGKPVNPARLEEVVGRRMEELKARI